MSNYIKRFYFYYYRIKMLNNKKPRINHRTQTLSKEEKILYSYNLYLFQQLPSGEIKCLNSGNNPVKQEGKDPHVSYTLDISKTYYCYFSSHELTDNRLRKLASDEKYKLTLLDEISSGKRKLNLNNSLTAWKLQIQNLEKLENKKIRIFLQGLIGRYEGELSDIYDGDTRVPIINWIIKNRYITVPDERTIDMYHFLKSVEEYLNDKIHFRELHLKAINETAEAAFQTYPNDTGKAQEIAKKIIKKKINSPVQIIGDVYGYWMGKTENEKGSFNNNSSTKLSDLVEDFFFSSARSNDQAMVSEVRAIMDGNPYDTNFPVQQIIFNLYKLHIPHIALNPPTINTPLSLYDLDGPVLSCNHVVWRNNKVSAIVGLKKEDLTAFTIAKYNSDLVLYESREIAVEYKQFLNQLNTKEGIEAHVQKVISSLVEVADYAGMYSRESFVFVVESARLYYYNMKFVNQKIQDYAFAAIMKYLADFFVWNGSRPIKYANDQVVLKVLHKRRYNTIRSGIDCVGFQLTGLYIMGYVYDNINCWGVRIGDLVNSKEAITNNIIQNIDQNDIPWYVKPVPRVFNRFAYDNKNYYYSYFDFNDKEGDEKDPEFFEEIFENGELKRLDNAVLPPEVKEQALNGTITSVEKIYDCIPDDAHFFSNGVRNVLANVFGIFDFHHADAVESEEKTGWIGVIRRKKKDKWALDRTGVNTKYSDDYVSHFYTEEEGDKIAHSTTGGLRSQAKYPSIRTLTKYYLRIALPLNRNKSSQT